MSWEQVIDSWPIPANLVKHWPLNRKRILVSCNSLGENFASLEVLNQLVYQTTLRNDLIWNDPPKPATLAGYEPEAPQPRQHRGIVDVVTNKAPAPESKKKTDAEWRAESAARAEAAEQQRVQEKKAREDAIVEREERQRRLRDILADASAIRPF
jgi:hypothetical protein